MNSDATNREGGGAPLTVLSEEEQIFRDTVRQFAEDQVRPLVARMDREGKMDPGLIRRFFELGLMAVEVPEIYGGAGADFFLATIAVEELSRVDASAAVVVDVQNTLVNNAILRWGTEEQYKSFFPRLAGDTVGSYALSEAGSGSDAFALATRAQEREEVSRSPVASSGSPTPPRRGSSSFSPMPSPNLATGESPRFWWIVAPRDSL